MTEESGPPSPSLYPPRRRWWRDVLLGLALFTCGVLVGGVVVTKVYTHRAMIIQRGGFDKPRAFARLERALDLNEEQAKKVREILGKGLDDLKGIRRSVRPQVDTTLERIRADVAAVLDERQKKKWEARFDSVREQWFPPPLDSTAKDGGKSN